MHEVLVNRLGGLSLPRKSVLRLTDRPDMTLDVYRGHKTTMQQQQQRDLIGSVSGSFPTYSFQQQVTYHISLVFSSSISVLKTLIQIIDFWDGFGMGKPISKMHFLTQLPNSLVIRWIIFLSKQSQRSRSVLKDRSRSLVLFRKGKIGIIAKFHRTDFVI